MECHVCNKMYERISERPQHDRISSFEFASSPNFKQPIRIDVCEECIFGLVIAWYEGRVEDIADADIVRDESGKDQV